jgi:hypothetical protein
LSFGLTWDRADVEKIGVETLHNFTAHTLIDETLGENLEAGDAELGDTKTNDNVVTEGGPFDPGDLCLLHHAIETRLVECSAQRGSHPAIHGVVDEGEVVGIEDDLLHVAFGVPDTQTMFIEHATPPVRRAPSRWR